MLIGASRPWPRGHVNMFRCSNALVVWFTRFVSWPLSGLTFLRRETCEASELPGVLETGEATGNGNHVDGDALPNAVDAYKELLLASQYRICSDKCFNLGIDGCNLLVNRVDDLLPAATFVFEVAGSHILLLIRELRLISFPVSKEELSVCKKILHGDQGGIWNAITDSLVAVAIGIFGDSGGVNGIVLTAGEAHGVFNAGGGVHPEEDVQLLTGYGQWIDVSACVLGADQSLIR